MKYGRTQDVLIKIFTALFLAVSLALTFTVSDYYIFNRVNEFGTAFVLSQWIKKCGLLLLPLAVYYNKRCCADAAKYILPIFIIISCFTFGSFFNITNFNESSSPAELVYASVNEFLPKAAVIALFFAACALELGVCVLLFIRDGFKVKVKSFICFPFAFIAVTPLNVFENFFDINDYSRESFLWFDNFTIWHLLAFVLLIIITLGLYAFLRNKDRQKQNDYLVAIAIVLLIQYHSKDSMVMGDGYNVYNTVFACIPLFICNMGTYVASVSVILRKRVLYSMSFFVHAAGAFAVFVYFGKAEMSNYGIIFSYSILYFCAVHCLLFALCVLPTMLGHYKFRYKDCIIPLIYYFLFIAVAAVSSTLVTSFSMGLSYNGYTLAESEWLFPNYAFTQINPFPFDFYVVPVRIWRYDMNLLYVIVVYLFSAALFFAFNGLYQAILAIKRHRKNKKQNAAE